MGVTYGRNVFQHRSPFLITKALKKIVIDKASVEEAMEVLKPAPSYKDVVLQTSPGPRTPSAC